MNGWSLLWADLDEDDYSEDSDAEMFFEEDEEDLVPPEFDEWYTEIQDVDGFKYVDVDENIHKERMFEKHVRRLFYTNPNVTKEQKKQNSERIVNEREEQKARSQSIHDRIVAALEEEKRRLSTNAI